MHRKALRRLLAATALALSSAAGATEIGSGSCQLPGSGHDPMADRAGLLAQYERLPPSCLQAIFAACTSAASRTLLDFGSAAICSFGYEALLKQRFGGNFGALLAWWRDQRDQPVQ